MNLKNAALLSFDAADTSDNIIHGLRSVFPSWSSFKNGLYSLLMLALLVLGILLFLLVVIKLAFNNINMLAAENTWLETKNGFPDRVVNLTGWQSETGKFCTKPYQPKSERHFF